MKEVKSLKREICRGAHVFYRIYTKITNVHQVHPMIVIALS
jgi:hypothetical protein